MELDDSLLDVSFELDCCSDELLETKLDSLLPDSELDDSDLLLPPKSQPVAMPMTNELRSSVLIIFFIVSPFLRFNLYALNTTYLTN